MLRQVAQLPTFLDAASAMSIVACDPSDHSTQPPAPNRVLPDAALGPTPDVHAPPPFSFNVDAARARPAPGTVTDVDAGLCVQLPDGGWGASACSACPRDAIADGGCDGRISKCAYYYGCKIACTCATAT